MTAMVVLLQQYVTVENSSHLSPWLCTYNCTLKMIFWQEIQISGNWSLSPANVVVQLMMRPVCMFNWQSSPLSSRLGPNHGANYIYVYQITKVWHSPLYLGVVLWMPRLLGQEWIILKGLFAHLQISPQLEIKNNTRSNKNSLDRKNIKVSNLCHNRVFISGLYTCRCPAVLYSVSQC